MNYLTSNITNFKARNLYSDDQHFIKSSLSCKSLKYISVLFILMFMISISFNTVLLKMFLTVRSLKNPMNSFIIALTVLNICATMIDFPINSINSFNCR